MNDAVIDRVLSYIKFDPECGEFSVLTRVSAACRQG